MSLTVVQRTRIKNYLMEKIFNNEKDVVKKTCTTFNVSSQTVYKYLHELIENNDVQQIERGKYRLVMKKEKRYIYTLFGKKLEEDIIYRETIEKYISKLDDNVRRIWEYGFTEMVNNVLEHSKANVMLITFQQNALYTWVNIMDNGVGIFEKIAQYYKYTNLDDAILNLFKGKLTTDEKNHSGEGIFFTSKAMDHFSAISSNKIFCQDNTHEECKDLKKEKTMNDIWEILEDKPGTVIVMVLSNTVDRTLKEVFDMYSSVDGGFTTTKIPIKQICDGGYPVSRSQAKRLYFGFDKFEKVILDFSGVEEIGQGFAHELFAVFKNKHPEIEMECINVNADVQKMINHVSR